MSATRKKHASQTWRAVLAGRQALQLGLVCRIANGAHTNIWNDKWLPGHFSGVPRTPRDGQTVANVEELITSSGSWNETLIHEVFFPVDAETILKLPIGGSVR